MFNVLYVENVEAQTGFRSDGEIYSIYVLSGTGNRLPAAGGSTGTFVSPEQKTRGIQCKDSG